MRGRGWGLPEGRSHHIERPTPGEQQAVRGHQLPTAPLSQILCPHAGQRATRAEPLVTLPPACHTRGLAALIGGCGWTIYIRTGYRRQQ